MNIEVSSTPLDWGSLDLSLFGLNHDWYGQAINPTVTYGFAVDLQNLWFVACQAKAAQIHPSARPGAFQSELWRHDVAEFFLVDPVTHHYLEFNLAPNGAWWACEFSEPRQRVSEHDSPLEGVATFADLAPDGSWMAAAALPLSLLRERFHFGDDSRMNATFIINSPTQSFLTAAKLSDGEPDFHLPAQFPKVKFFHHPAKPTQE